MDGMEDSLKFKEGKILISLTRVFFIRRHLLKLRKHLGEWIAAAVLCAAVRLGSSSDLAALEGSLRYGQPIFEAIADGFGRYQSSGEGCSDDEKQESPHPDSSLSNELWILTGFLPAAMKLLCFRKTANGQ